jgi:hypothetical protein
MRTAYVFVHGTREQPRQTARDPLFLSKVKHEKTNSVINPGKLCDPFLVTHG